MLGSFSSPINWDLIILGLPHVLDIYPARVIEAVACHLEHQRERMAKRNMLREANMA